MPRELCKTIHPDYIIEPPDVLEIQAIRLVPKMPYRLGPLDVVTIVASGVLPEPNLTGQYSVQIDGSIPLGLELGNLHAAGLTIDQLEANLLALLEERFQEPKVSISLAQMGLQQQVAGEHLVAPDGKVNLGAYGRVQLVGLTIEEATDKLETHLSQYLTEPEIAVDVLGYNSKVYYVVTQGAGLGDGVVILPSRGNETVIDAIGQMQGLRSTSSTRMWVARPGGNNCGGDQILPVDWPAITQRGDVTTNYQLLPGDRLYVSEDKLVAFDTKLAKLFAPIERVFGITILGNSAVQSFDRQNRNGSGF